MKKIVVLLLTLLFVGILAAQYTFKAVIKSKQEGESLIKATAILKNHNKVAVADSTGLVIFENIPAGRQVFLFSHVGHKELEKEFIFPLQTTNLIEIFLEEGVEHEEEEVIISATRTSRTIENIPTRVETISGEELDEKGNMKPGDIRMLLSETTGIQTQQTSATSYNSSIRIQGLDGRYTQILKDGYPLYAGFSGGLSIMQIVPLDLKQVEVIKGSSSTLYGGGAIAGLVNLVSKVPHDERQLNFLANATSAKGFDFSSFYSQRFKKTGITLLASRNSGTAYDPADIGLTAIPKFERYTINPRLFVYFNHRTTMNVGFNSIWEDRLGGNINYIKNGTTGYFEKNKTNRFSTQAGFDHEFNDKSKFSFRNSFNRFKRRIEIPGYFFEGLQTSSFNEAAYDLRKGKVEWITGVNILTEKFTEEKRPAISPRDYTLNTFGAFVQSTWNAFDWVILETGLRGDYINEYGLMLLPRISALFKMGSKLTSRIGGGLGYKAPTVFTEDAERIQFQNVLPVNKDQSDVEKSAGVNVDINYRTTFFNDAVKLSVNHLFFYTRLNKPLILSTVFGSSNLAFKNANGHIDTRGMETNLKFIYRHFKLFIGYTYADVNTHFNNVKEKFLLTSRHRLNNVLMYEIEEKLKLGLEAYYFSPQKLNDGAKGKSYWVCGFMAEKFWKKFSVFINFENFLDARQTRFDSIFTGTIINPVFRDIYAPVDGFVINGGFKVKL